MIETAYVACLCRETPGALVPRVNEVKPEKGMGTEDAAKAARQETAYCVNPNRVDHAIFSVTGGMLHSMVIHRCYEALPQQPGLYVAEVEFETRPSGIIQVGRVDWKSTEPIFRGWFSSQQQEVAHG